MSCNTKTSLAAVIDAVNAQLNNNYVDRDDPRINQGVFTEPTIRGGLMLDEAAKLDFCGYVTECGQREPFGKQWVDRPLYPDTTLVSYEDEGEIKSRWQDTDDFISGLVTDTRVTTVPPPGAQGMIPRKQSDMNAEQVYVSDFVDDFDLDATAGLQNLFDYCELNNKTAIVNKACEVSDTLYASCNIDGTNGTLIYPSEYKRTGLVYAAEKSETTSTRLYDKRAIFPVIAGGKTSNGWDSVAGSTGLKIINAMQCEFNIPDVYYFEDGVVHIANSTDANYNKYDIGRIVFNKRNLVLQVNGQSSRSSANQNTFNGGRFALGSSEGQRVVGTRMIHCVVHGDTGSSCNNNTFINPSVEGSADEYAMLFENTGGSTNGISYNTVLNCRLESGGVAGKKIGFMGPNVRWNKLDNGYGVDISVLEETLGGHANSFTSSQGKVYSSSSGMVGANITLTNGGGLNNSLISVFPVGTDFAQTSDTVNSVFNLTSTTLETGTSGAPFRRFSINLGAGIMSWGTGYSALDTDLRRKSVDALITKGTFEATRGLVTGGAVRSDTVVSTGNISTSGKLLTSGGLGVGNAVEATTQPTTPIKKIEIFNELGVSIGWIPVYADIT